MLDFRLFTFQRRESSNIAEVSIHFRKQHPFWSMLNQWLMRLQEMFFEQQGLNYFWLDFVVLLLLLSSLLLHRLKIINNKLKSVH
jgi:hypothetical protein